MLWFLPCSWNIFLVVNCFSCLLQWSIVTVFDCHFDYPSVSFTLSLWSRIAKGPDRSTKPLARFFACSLAPLTHSLALHCLLCLRAMLHSLARLLAHFTHFLACGKVKEWMVIYSVFYSLLDHSEVVIAVWSRYWRRIKAKTRCFNLILVNHEPWWQAIDGMGTAIWNWWQKC